MKWLPELGKFLPNSWCEVFLILDKAVKADEDPVPENLWSNCIQLVFISATYLKGFQTLALVWQQKAMYWQF
jgi:hypothetical protein